MFDERSEQVNRSMFLLDIFTMSLAFLISYWLRLYLFEDSPVDFFSHFSVFPLILFLMMLFLSYFGAYVSPRRMTVVRMIWSIFRAEFISMGLLFTLLFLLNIDYVSRVVIGAFSLSSFLLLIGVRLSYIWYFKNSLKKGENYKKVLIIGTGMRAYALSEALRQRSEWGIDIIGHIDPEADRVGTKVLESSVLGTVDDISIILKQNVVDDVILAIPRTMLSDVEDIAHACEEEGINLRFMADLYDLQVTRVSLSEVGNIPLLTLEPIALDETKLFFKRCFDLILITISLPLLIPLFLIIAIAIKLDSKGPVFFVQQRVGLRKRLFGMIKFRSMVENAEALMQDIEHLNEAEGPIFKIKNDPRVTSVGRFLRKTSLDELPQLINILLGHMSLVGPRPMSIRDVDLFDRGKQRRRFSVKPGITCLWQISGRSSLPFSKWLELDLQYIDNWSLFLDIKILFKTFPAVIFSKGAM